MPLSRSGDLCVRSFREASQKEAFIGTQASITEHNTVEILKIGLQFAHLLQEILDIYAVWAASHTFIMYTRHGITGS